MNQEQSQGELNANKPNREQSLGEGQVSSNPSPRLRELEKEAEQAEQRGDIEEAKLLRSRMRHAPRPLSLDLLKEAADAEAQAGNTPMAEALQKIIAAPAVSTLSPNANQSTIHPHPNRKENLTPATYYPAGQGRQNLENYPISSNQSGQNKPPSVPNAPKGQTQSGGK